MCIYDLLQPYIADYLSKEIDQMNWRAIIVVSVASFLELSTFYYLITGCSLSEAVVIGSISTLGGAFYCWCIYWFCCQVGLNITPEEAYLNHIRRPETGSKSPSHHVFHEIVKIEDLIADRVFEDYYLYQRTKLT